MAAKCLPVNIVQSTQCKHIFPILGVLSCKFPIQNGDDATVTHHDVARGNITMCEYDGIVGTKRGGDLVPVQRLCLQPLRRPNKPVMELEQGTERPARARHDARDHDALAVKTAEVDAAQGAHLRNVAAELGHDVGSLVVGQHRPCLLQRLAFDVFHRDAVPRAADDLGDRNRRVGLDEAQRQRLVRVVVCAHAVRGGRVFCDGVAVAYDVAGVAVVDDVAFGIGSRLARGRGRVAEERLDANPVASFPGCDRILVE